MWGVMELTVDKQDITTEKRMLDMDNLLANAQIGALYLDKSFRIRRVTPLVTNLTGIEPEDVGKDLSELIFLEEYPDLQEDAEHCAAERLEIEREISHEGRILLFRICPYLDGQGNADGVIIVLYDITGRRRKEEELRERTRKDSMTGLLNHTAVQKQIMEKLEELGKGTTAYLIICDLDNFKQINDTKGHFFGDSVICSFAEKLKNELPEAVKGRIGGDEFLAYVEDMKEEELKSRLEAVSRFMTVDDVKENTTGKISCSIGVARVVYGCADYNVAFQWADCALYQVKDGEKHSFRILDVPENLSLPEIRYLPSDEDSANYVDDEAFLQSEEELVLFCMEILENVPDIKAALRMISERTCRYFGLDDMICVEHSGDANEIVSQWNDVDRIDFSQEILRPGVYRWDILKHLADPDGCIAYTKAQALKTPFAKPHSIFMILSTSVRDYTGSIAVEDRNKDRDWVRMKSTLTRIASQIFYKLRLLKKEAQQRREMDLRLNYDTLTGLPVFNHFMNSAREYMIHYGNEKLCCVYTDFSGFQYYNEVYGFEKGDNILRRFADALTERYGACGLFGRISSDKFVGLIQGMTVEEAFADYKQFTASFTEECNKEFVLTNLVLASGLYGARPSDISITMMVDNANEARKKCKEQIVETMVKVYTDELRQEIENANTINSNILKGLKNGEFHAYMQPKVSLRSGKIEGAEALVRWIRPDGSRVMPDEFIGIAEKNGYVTKIDFEVLEQTLQYLADAISKGEEVVPVSVNFSRRNNEFDDFVPNVLAKLEEYHIPSRLLEAEVTESVFMADLSTVDQNMHRLREQGVEISVDDFGSGYSSLNMLAKVSADTIKLDRLFLNNAKKDERGLTVIQYLTKMLKRLGFTVLAEGVETEEQLNWLKMADCDLVQGFYYAKPMSIEDFRIFMKEFNARAEKAREMRVQEKVQEKKAQEEILENV